MSPEEKKELEAARNKANDLQTQNDQLRKELNEKTGTPDAVKGSFEAKWKDPMGKERSRKFGFAPGHKFLWLNGFKVPTEEVLAIANGKKVEDDILKQYPWLNTETASEHLTLLAKIGYGYLEDRK